MEFAEVSTVDWSRAQFALTAMYHFLFVPLTLGLSFIVAIMETVYVRTQDPAWKALTKFWMTLFAINFAIGVATGLILEFEFGTNWSNYSWIVGDIFGAPLAVEGILAFFLEATFFAVMFFGWDRVSQRFHLLSTWLVAIGSNLSAFWILVANGWMQFPVGMKFNPDTVRYEMQDFFAVALSPVAVSKFLHTIGSGYMVASLFVIGISAWFLLKGRERAFAKRSIIIAASFGLLSSGFLLVTGDESAYQVAQKQPMKLAAMEGLYDGHRRSGIVAVGVLDPAKQIGDGEDPFVFSLEVPYALSYLGYRDINAFVPGIEDLVLGNEEQGIPAAQERIERGRLAVAALKSYRELRKAEVPDEAAMAEQRSILERNMQDFGYGFLEEPEQTVPPVALNFYSFHVMVGLGSFFVVLMLVVLYLAMNNALERYPLILRLAVASIPLGWVAAEAGWIVAEVGRQPWAIQDLLPTAMSATPISTSHVQATFWMFAVLFTLLLVIEIRIMLRQIKIGPQGGH